MTRFYPFGRKNSVFAVRVPVFGAASRCIFALRDKSEVLKRPVYACFTVRVPMSRLSRPFFAPIRARKKLLIYFFFTLYIYGVKTPGQTGQGLKKCLKRPIYEGFGDFCHRDKTGTSTGTSGKNRDKRPILLLKQRNSHAFYAKKVIFCHLTYI
jgi:hypothetical protein